MYKCSNCSKEFKTEFWKDKHEKSCVVVESVLVEYYEGHPRRMTKLMGLLNRTFDEVEREKIKMIMVKEC